VKLLSFRSRFLKKSLHAQVGFNMLRPYVVKIAKILRDFVRDVGEVETICRAAPMQPSPRAGSVFLFARVHAYPSLKAAPVVKGVVHN